MHFSVLPAMTQIGSGCGNGRAKNGQRDEWATNTTGTQLRTKDNSRQVSVSRAKIKAELSGRGRERPRRGSKREYEDTRAERGLLLALLSC